ncbi:uncharacterized protein B0I36DRAFT_357330 [Microdochium trichocladiopsis]|uniref:Uncharacterized protein n=1 Tax=Microdochium trichocladiopsis TaxID=1682393 RepID=A0A9P8YDT3_9PEZI|nr:uncharacterized protein B0I36DRAFT_357330 [Microdochium trichocladiopsis]KAH7039962.1 hypothetical protein B0I36DRAFT_357330 [Microdochium trichocladiopsis]
MAPRGKGKKKGRGGRKATQPAGPVAATPVSNAGPSAASPARAAAASYSLSAGAVEPEVLAVAPQAPAFTHKSLFAVPASWNEPEKSWAQSYRFQPMVDADGEWYTFKVVEDASKQWVDAFKSHILNTIGLTLFQKDEEDGNLPLVLDSTTTGDVWVTKNLVGKDGRLLYGGRLGGNPNKSVKIRLTGQRGVSVDGVQQPGWQCLGEGITLASKIRLGKPARIPASVENLVSDVNLPEVEIPEAGPFYTLHDVWFQTIVGNSDTFGEKFKLDESVLHTMNDKKRRHEIIASLIEASQHAGTWDLLGDGPVHPRDMYEKLKAFDPQRDSKECDKFEEHIYGIRERAVVPKGSDIRADSIVLPSGKVVEDTSVLNLTPGISARDIVVWGAYDGATKNMADCYKMHCGYIFGSQQTINAHYKVSRMLTQLNKHDFRMFRLLSMPPHSTILNTTSGRYVAEQCMVSYDDSVNPELLRMGQALAHGTLEQDSLGRLACIAFCFPIAQVLRDSHHIARKAIGLPESDTKTHAAATAGEIVIGQNWSMPMERSQLFQALSWIRLPVCDKNGVVYKYMYLRPTLSKVYKSESSGSKEEGLTYSINPGPGDMQYNIGDHSQLEEGQMVAVTWETYVKGRGPHPYRVASVPVPGPIEGDIWDRTGDIAVQIQYKGAKDGLNHIQYLTQPGGRAKEVTSNMSHAAKVIAGLTLPVAQPLTHLAMLESWHWQHGAPDWFKATCHPRVHEYNFDYYDRVWRVTRVRGPSFGRPQIVGGGTEVSTATFEANYNRLVELLRDHPKYMVGTQVGSQSKCCEHVQRWNLGSVPQYEPYLMRLSNGEEVCTCLKCAPLGRPCIFLKSGGDQRTDDIRGMGIWKLVTGDVSGHQYSRKTVLESRLLADLAALNGGDEE